MITGAPIPWIKTHSTATDPADLRNDINIVAQHTPRFLFWAWHAHSGGRVGLNTTSAITPLAFYQNHGPATMHDLPQDILSAMASGHFSGNRISTCFSSWSQSLAFVLSVAAYLGKGEPYVSIIDTTKLPPHNKVLWTAGMQEVAPGFAGGSHEYLAFGVIEGEAHKAVGYQNMVKHELAKVCRASTLSPGLTGVGSGTFPPAMSSGGVTATSSAAAPPKVTENRILQTTLELGDLFGEQFKLPVAAYLLSFQKDDGNDPARYVKELLSSGVGVPDDWRTDRITMEEGYAHTGQLHETDQAIGLLRNLVKETYGDSGDPSSIEGQDAVSEQQDVAMSEAEAEPSPSSSQTEGAEAEACAQPADSSPPPAAPRQAGPQHEHDTRSKPKASLEFNDHISREVNNLYINVVGAEEHKEELMEGMS